MPFASNRLHLEPSVELQGWKILQLFNWKMFYWKMVGQSDADASLGIPLQPPATSCSRVLPLQLIFIGLFCSQTVST